MKIRLASPLIVALACAACCNAGVLRFSDLTDDVSLTLDGVAVTGNVGRITNFSHVGESISFDLAAPGVLASAFSGYTNLLETGDPLNSVSDRFVYSFTTPFQTLHVIFGSDPDLPAIPGGATDLTTIPLQGLPADPYFEDGTSQKVATLFLTTGISDTFFIQSDVGDAPEPGSMLLIATGLGLAALLRRRLS